MKEEIKQKLIELGWIEVFADKEWVHDRSDRYVEIDEDYIDFYGYNYDTEEKYKGWLTKEEIKLFAALVNEGE